MDFIIAFLSLIGIGVSFSGIVFIAIQVMADCITKKCQTEIKPVVLFVLLTMSLVFNAIMLIKNIEW